MVIFGNGTPVTALLLLRYLCIPHTLRYCHTFDVNY
jgi:hypothetical protein